MANTNRNIIFSPEELQKAIAEAIAAREAQKEQEAKEDVTDQMNNLTVKAFRKAGYNDIQPRVNIKTYSLWMKEGRKVKAGEKSIAVKSLRLFHIDQTEPVSKPEQAEYLARLEAKYSAAKLPVVSAVSVQPVLPMPSPKNPQLKSEPEVEAAKNVKGSKPDGKSHPPQPNA